MQLPKSKKRWQGATEQQQPRLAASTSTTSAPRSSGSSSSSTRRKSSTRAEISRDAAAAAGTKGASSSSKTMMEEESWGGAKGTRSMLFMVDPHSGVPIFRQLMEQVKLAIAGGRLSPGQPLPSVRSLAVPLGVNPMTISKAYNLLEREGLLERRPGKPLVVADLPEDERRARRLSELERELRPAAALCLRLDIDPDEAVALLRRVIAELEESS